jgi:hypothetical protein
MLGTGLAYGFKDPTVYGFEGPSVYGLTDPTVLHIVVGRCSRRGRLSWWGLISLEQGRMRQLR